MNSHPYCPRLPQALRRVTAALAVAVLAGCYGPLPAQAATLTLFNPNWNITLTNCGYSDYLLDNTPGFEGREYLSGEWGAAVAYQLGGGATVTPQWLEPNFVYPDWVTNSKFHVVSPITQTGVNADNLPIAQSVISNNEVEVTLRFEMLDTVTGTPMGTAPASATGAGTFINSNRYVLKQTYNIRNITAATLSNIQLFQLLHGLQSQRGMYDNRSYAGALSEFRYDVTEAGVDAGAVGAGSSGAGLEDFIGFHASVAPSGYEIGHYGIEGNGVDNHSIGKPSDGVHLSIEDNWQSAPYSTRLGTDAFAPAQRWVAGAERWNLGELAAGEAVSHDVVLSLRTGTKVLAGAAKIGGCNGGANVPGGLDYQFASVIAEGSCFAGFARANDAELAMRVAAGEFDGFTFLTPGHPAQVWDVEFSGTYAGAVSLTLSYDATLLPAGFDESTLAIYHFSGGVWQAQAGVVDPFTHRIAFSTNSLGPFALGVEGGVTCQIAASESPADGGSVSGAGTYALTSTATLAASPSHGYVFANWTENDTVVSTSPSYTFPAYAERSLVANFVAAGADNAISTSSTPSDGGATGGDGAYVAGVSATVVATANPGYTFSKWLENGAAVSNASSSYTFSVAGDRALVAIFKPLYTVAVSAAPAAGGEAEPDAPAYESGAMAVMIAFPASGYSFVNWTQNGVPVSTAAIFSFNVTGNRVLVANFAPGARIDLSANPKTAGIISGGGVYASGDTVALSAVAKPGYLFTDWTEGGNEVSTAPNYSFTSADSRALVANFIVLPGLALSVPSPGSLAIAWPAGADGWLLEESADLNPGSWAECTRPVVIDGTQKQVIVIGPSGTGFFRLKHP